MRGEHANYCYKHVYIVNRKPPFNPAIVLPRLLFAGRARVVVRMLVNKERVIRSLRRRRIESTRLAENPSVCLSYSVHPTVVYLETCRAEQQCIGIYMVFG